MTESSDQVLTGSLFDFYLYYLYFYIMKYKRFFVKYQDEIIYALMYGGLITFILTQLF